MIGVVAKVPLWAGSSGNTWWIEYGTVRYLYPIVRSAVSTISETT
jgi:hypothetical protein